MSNPRSRFELANDVLIYKRGKFMTMKVDGNEFPYHLALADVVATIDPRSPLKRITLELLFDGDLLVHDDKAGIPDVQPKASDTDDDD